MGQRGRFRTIIGKADVPKRHPTAAGRPRMLWRLQAGGAHDLIDTAQRSARQHHPRGGKHDLGQRGGDDSRKHRVKGKIGDKTGQTACGQRAGREEQRRGYQKHERALGEGQVYGLGYSAHIRLVVLGLGAVILDRLLESLERIDRLLEYLDHRNAAHILSTRLADTIQRGLILRHNFGVFAAHHGKHGDH